MNQLHNRWERRGGGSDNSNQNGYMDHLAHHYRQRLLQESNLEGLLKLPLVQLRLAIETKVAELIAEEKVIISSGDKSRLINMIIDESVGYGPLEPLLKDSSITEIMVNSPEEVFVERGGKIYLSEVRFKDHEHIRHIIERIIAPIGRRIDESSPMVDARLRDGSRVNAVIPPVSLNGPIVSIRKFNKDPLTVDDLIQFGSLTKPMGTFLDAAVKSKLNILISGGTGSGKTTLLNLLATFIPGGERVVTIEDMAELRLLRPNVVGLEARPANMENKGEITIRQLVKNALRMRPDRIVVGEVRGAEALDMLQAMNTGHEGSLTTIHSNNPKDALSRLEAMVVMNNDSISVEVVRSYMISALDLIVQCERLSDGSRKIVAITEFIKDPSGKISLNEVFAYKRKSTLQDGQVIGQFTASGKIPYCLERMKTYGIQLGDNLFEGDI